MEQSPAAGGRPCRTRAHPRAANGRYRLRQRVGCARSRPQMHGSAIRMVSPGCGRVPTPTALCLPAQGRTRRGGGYPGGAERRSRPTPKALRLAEIAGFLSGE